MQIRSMGLVNKPTEAVCRHLRDGGWGRVHEREETQSVKVWSHWDTANQFVHGRWRFSTTNGLKLTAEVINYWNQSSLRQPTEIVRFLQMMKQCRGRRKEQHKSSQISRVSTWSLYLYSSSTRVHILSICICSNDVLVLDSSVLVLLINTSSINCSLFVLD